MGLASFLHVVAAAFFTLLAVLTGLEFVRHRERLPLYTMLLLGTLALSLLLSVVPLPSTSLGSLQSGLQWLCLLAHPLIFLLLLGQFHTVPTVVYGLAIGGLFYSSALLFSTLASPLWLTVPIPLYFVGVELYAAVTVWRGASLAQGVARPRLRLVAVASAVMGLIVFLLGLSLFWGSAQEALQVLILFLALLAAGSYYLGFTPPAWLSRNWQLAEVHNFLEQVALHPPEERPLVVTALLRETAMRMVSAADVVIACWADREELLLIESNRELEEMARQLDNHIGLAGRVWQTQQAVVQVGTEGLAEMERQVMNALKVNTIIGIPVATSERIWGVVLVFLLKRPIFETADINLLTLLAHQMANILVYTALLAEQNLLIARLNRQEADLRQAHEYTQTLAHIAAHLNAQVGLEPSLREICRTVAQMLQVPLVTISLYDEEKKLLFLAHDYGLPDYVRQKLQAFPGELHDAYAQLAGSVMLIPDIRELANLLNRDVYSQMDLRTTVNVTMWYGDLLIGRLNIGTIGQIRDFSEQEITLLKGIADQAAIAIHRISLHQQVQEHAVQLEQRVQLRTLELQARNHELDAFAHTVAHDLKSPLALIVGFAGLLMDEYERMPADEIKRLLNYILHSSHKMSDIVDALLLLARVRQEEVTLEVLDMAEIIKNVQMRLAFMVQEYGATIITPPSWPVALGYAPWLEEAWANYLSNAIKYGGTPPHVEIGASRQDTHTLRFWVRDNGTGISPEQQAKLFVPFTRLNENHSHNGSHGLGLSIVERIVTRLGGEVGCESEPGQGSLFYLTLPCAENRVTRSGVGQ